MYAETSVTNYLPAPLTSQKSVKLKFAARRDTQIFIPFPHFFPSSGQDRSHAPLSSLFNPLNPELNPICYLLALLAHHFLHISRIRVKSLIIRPLMSYIYMERLFLMFLDHTQRRSTVGRTPLDE